MMAGLAKTKLAGTDDHFELSIPVPVIGAKTILGPKANIPGALIRLDLEGSPMILGIWRQGLNQR